MMKIREFVPALNLLNEQSGTKPELSKYEDLLRNVDIDISCLEGISDEVTNLAETHGVSRLNVITSMLVIAATASGRNITLHSPQVGKNIHPAIMCVNGGDSGTGKSGATDALLEDTLEKRNMKMEMENNDAIDVIDADETTKDGQKDYLRKEANKEAKNCVLTDITIPALNIALNMSAVCLVYDEIKNMFKIFCPGEAGSKDDNTVVLTQHFSKRNYSAKRVGDAGRSSFNTALNMLGNCTPSTAKKLYSKPWLEDGTTYRFLITHSVSKEPVLYDSGGCSARLALPRVIPKKPANFIKKFDEIFDRYYNMPVPVVCDYDAEAAELKDIVSRGILDSYEAVYLAHGKRIQKVMVLKIHNFIDKLSLIFHLLGVGGGPPKSLSLTPQVSAECVELAFSYMRCMYSNWLDIIALELPNDQSELDEISENSVHKAGDKYIKEFIKYLGGPGDYYHSKIDDYLYTKKGPNKTRQKKALLLTERIVMLDNVPGDGGLKKFSIS